MKLAEEQSTSGCHKVPQKGLKGRKVWDAEFCGFFWLHHAAHKILVPQPGIKPLPPALEAWGVNHWTNKEVPGRSF